MDLLTEIKKLQDTIISYRRSDPAKSYELCEELLALSNEAGNDYGCAFAQYYMCDVKSNEESFDNTVKKLRKLIGPFHEAGFYEFEIKAYNLLGITYDNKYDTFLALDSYNKGISIAREYSFPLLEALTGCNIGCVFARLNDQKTALAFFASAYRKLEELEAAPDLAGYKQLIATNLAITNILLGNYEDAKEAYRIATKDEDTDSLCSATLFIAKAMICLHENDRESAHKYAKMGIDYYLENHSIFDTFDTNINIYTLLYNLEEYELLERYFEVTLEHAKKKKLDAFRRDMYELYIDYLEQRGEEEKLCKYYKTYYDLNSKVSSRENKAASKGMKLKLSLRDASSKREEALERNKTLAQISQTDTLTHLPNRYKYDSSIPYYFSRAQKEQKNFCYVILDVDCFKQYNDTYGHLKGDSCLWHISSVLRSEMTNDVSFFRYGGDEFAGIYFDKSDKYVSESLARLQKGIKALSLEHASSLRDKIVSISIGYVNRKPAATDKVIDLISDADMLLYKEKASWKEPKLKKGLSEHQ